MSLIFSVLIDPGWGVGTVTAPSHTLGGGVTERASVDREGTASLLSNSCSMLYEALTMCQVLGWPFSVGCESLSLTASKRVGMS